MLKHCLATLCMLLLSALVQSAPQRPNILLVIADDLGYTDIGAFGGEIDTPVLDSLASQSIKMTNFYTAPTCSPTRAMLFTGVDNHKVGMSNMAEALAPNQRGQKNYEGYLNFNAAFLPKSFKDSGYRTMMTGKWHLGYEKNQRPFARGFDQTWVLLDGGASHFDDVGIDRMHAEFSHNGEDTTLPEDFYSSQFYTDKLIEFIGADSTTPFFSVLSYTAPHWPLMAKQSTIDKYRGKYDQGYDELYGQRLASAKAQGVVSAKATEVPMLRDLKPWAELNDEERATDIRRAEIYAAMIDDLDSNLGRLIQHLKSTDQFENTLIFFMSDNGVEGSSLEREFKRFQPHVDACCDNSLSNMGKVKSYVLLGPRWARSFAGGSNGYKGRVTEGGIKSPAFLKLPGESVGSISNQFTHVKDVLPTLMDIAGISLPTDASVRVEGSSYFDNAERPIKQAWEFMGGKAFRRGDWKVVAGGQAFYDEKWHLFNLADDPSEQIDLASEQPQILAELINAFQDYEREHSIIYPIFAPGKGFQADTTKH